MRHSAVGFGIALAVSLSAFTGAHAQELESGTWGGTMSPPDGGSVPVTFEVSNADGALSITLVAPGGMQTMAFNDAALDGDELTFWWRPGPRVDCTLARQDDGRFQGECKGEDGSTGRLTMTPPA